MQDGKIRPSDIIDSEGIVKEISRVNEVLKETIKLMGEAAKSTVKTKTNDGLKKTSKEILTLEEKALQVIERKTKAQELQAEVQRQILQGNAEELKSQSQIRKEVEGKNKIQSGDQRYIRSQERLANYYLQQSKQLVRLKEQYKALALRKEQGIRLTRKEEKQMRRLGDEVRRLDARLKKVDAATGDFRRNVGNYSSALGPAIKGLRQFAAALGIASALQLFSQALRDGFRRIKEFDQAQADLAAILGKNKREIGALTQQAKLLGSVTAFTASEVSDLQLELAKLGFNEKEILAATEGVENLALATGVKAARAAELAGAAVRGFALEASEANRVASVLAVSTTKSANSFASLEIALPKVASLAKAFGFTIEDTTALLGSLRNAGFEASVAGTSLRNIFVRLANENSKLSKELGGPAKNFDELIEKFKLLEESGVSLSKAFELTDRRSVAAFKVFLQNADQIKDLRDNITDVQDELDQIAKTKLESITGKATLFASAWEGLVTSIDDGNGFLSRFIGLVLDNGADVLRTIREWNLSFDELLDDKKAIKQREELNKQRKIYKELGDLALETAEKDKEGVDNRISTLKSLIANQKLVLGFTKDQFEEQLKGNRNAGISVMEYKGAVDEQEESLLKLNEELAEQLGKQQAINEVLEKYKKLVDDTNKSEDDGNEDPFVFGSIGYYESKIKILQEQQKNLATSNAQFKSYQKDIDNYQNKIAQLSEGLSSIAYWEGELARLRQQQELATTAAEYGKLGEEIKKAELRLLELNTALKGVLFDSGLKAEIKGIGEAFGDIAKSYDDLELDPEKALKETVTKSLEELEEYWTQVKAGEQSVTDFMKLQGRLRQQLAEQVAGSMQGAFNAYLDNKIAGIEREIEQENEKYDLILNRDDLTDKQRAALEEERRIREKQLQEERNKELKKQDKLNKAFALAQIIIEAAKAKAAAFTPPPVGLGPVLGASLLPLIIANAAFQSAAVLAAPPPQFFKGTDHAPKGWAWTDEQGAEVHLDRFGAIKDFGSDQGPRLKYLEQGDKILRADKSKEFLKQMQGVSNEEIVGQIYQKHDYRRDFIVQNQTISTQGIENRLDKVNRNIAKLASRPVVFKGNINMNPQYNKYN